MFTMMAHGYVARQPELVQVNAHAVKIEFDLLDKRNVRSGNDWKQVTESVRFVAWNDDARRLAEQLLPGKTLSVTGQQETSWWTDASGAEKHRTLFKVLSFQFDSTWDRQQQPQRQPDQGHAQANGRGYAPQGGGGRNAPGQQFERAAPERSNRFQPRNANAGSDFDQGPSDGYAAPERRPLPLPARNSNADHADSNGFVRY